MRIVLDPPQLDSAAHFMLSAAQELDLLESTLVARPLPETPPDIAAAVQGLLLGAERTITTNTIAIRNEAAQLELRALIAEGVGRMPTGAAAHGKSWLERLVEFERTMTGNDAAQEVLQDFFKYARPVAVSGYWRGSTWVNAYNRRLPGQAQWAAKFNRVGNVLAFLTATAAQLNADSGERYPLGEKLLRAGTAGSLALGESVVIGVGAQAVVGTTFVASMIPEVAILGVPGVGEAAAVVLIAVGVGYVTDKYVFPAVKDQVFKLEHWALNDGLHDAENVVGAVGHGIVDAGSTFVHGVGSAASGVVHGFQTGFGLWG